MSRPSQRVHLVDASPYIFRAFFSLPSSITDTSGQPANAVYGFGSFLVKLLDDESVNHLALAFDRSLNTSFRNEIYPDYKAQRELPPADLERQLAGCEELARALGVTCFASERYEADDLIASLAGPLLEDGHRLVVVSSDKDLMQLVSDQVEFLDYARGERYGPDEVVSKMGVRPDQVTDFLGLAGDSVDNIPGVPGIGKKTATALLLAFPSIEAALADLDSVAKLEIRGAKSLAKKLDQHRDIALLSKRLATLAHDATAGSSLEALAYEGAEADEIDPVLEQYGFRTLGERIRRRPSRDQE